MARLAADVSAAVAALRPQCGDGRAAEVRPEDRQQLVAALSDVAACRASWTAIGAAHRHRGSLACGWPPVRWIRRFRPDPLRRLQRRQHGDGVGRRRSACDGRPARAGRDRRASRGRRGERGLPPPWPMLVRRAAARTDDRIVDRLDQAVGAAGLDTGSPLSVAGRLAPPVAPGLGGGGGSSSDRACGGRPTGSSASRTSCRCPSSAAHRSQPGWCWAASWPASRSSFLARLVTSAGARRRQRAAERALRPGIEAVADELILGPGRERARGTRHAPPRAGRRGYGACQ